jgi:uncharacterized protein YndB with AHSA1/START domain
LTEPDLLTRWWVRGDVRPRVGHRFTLDMGALGQQAREVVAVDTSAGGFLDTTVTWCVVPEGAGTRLHLEHARFDLGSQVGHQRCQEVGKGWPAVSGRVDTWGGRPR